MSRIVLCENNEFFRHALLRVIYTHIPKVEIRAIWGEEECMLEIEDFKPDILILGMNSYSGPGFKQLERVRRIYPGLTIILFTDYGIDEYRKEAILKGANQIISKEFWTGGEILALLRTVLSTTSANLLKISAEGEEEGDTDILKQPLERRRGGKTGRTIEHEYLTKNPDRRTEGKKWGLYYQ